jgi:hypothetical protein
VSHTSEYLADAKRRQRERERAAGLCTSKYAGCTGAVEPGKSRCLNCADEHAARGAKRYATAQKKGGLPWQQKRRKKT